MWNDTVPFKFDIPSPDDVVSNGLRSSKVGLKGIFLVAADFIVALVSVEKQKLKFLFNQEEAKHGPTFIRFDVCALLFAESIS